MVHAWLRMAAGAPSTCPGTPGSGPAAQPLPALLLQHPAAPGQAGCEGRRDILLLEVGWAALWLAPRGRAGAAREPARAAVWLQRWVLFKLMFCSGAVKIQARGDASRRPALTSVRPAELLESDAKPSCQRHFRCASVPWVAGHALDDETCKLSPSHCCFPSASQCMPRVQQGARAPCCAHASATDQRRSRLPQARCPTWLHLTACHYHAATQCLPTPLAWYFHQLPGGQHPARPARRNYPLQSCPERASVHVTMITCPSIPRSTGCAGFHGHAPSRCAMHVGRPVAGKP